MRPALLFRLTAFLLLAVALVQAQAPPLPPEKVVEIYGQKIHYIEAGQGPTVILLHGLGAEVVVWTPTFLALSASHHVYAMDLLGFGHSDKPLIEYEIQTWVEFLQGFMQALKIPRATLIGNSLGGWIAIDFAFQHPDMVDKLVLVDAAGMRLGRTITEDALAGLNPGSLQGNRVLMSSIFYDPKTMDDATVRSIWEQRMRSGDSYTIQRTLHNFFVKDQWIDQKAAALKVPTLIVWGRNDVLTTLASAEGLEKAIVGSKLVVFDNCGHMPQMEKPQEFNTAVLAFLK